MPTITAEPISTIAEPVTTIAQPDPNIAEPAGAPEPRIAGGQLLRLVPSVDPSALPTPARRPKTLPRSIAEQPDDQRPRHLVGKFAKVILEVLQQRRPTGQMSRWLNERSEVALQVWARHPIWEGASVGSARACLISADVVEGCFRVDFDQRSTMITLRLERRRQAWVCTEFEPLCTRGMTRRAA